MLKQCMKVGHITFHQLKILKKERLYMALLKKFALAMFQCSAPTLLAYGGTYANITNLPIENIHPFAFPFGIGGPKMNRRVKVSLELCIQLYFRLSLQQFMEGLTISVLNHTYKRQMSYISSVMTCRSTVNGIS